MWSKRGDLEVSAQHVPIITGRTTQEFEDPVDPSNCVARQLCLIVAAYCASALCGRWQ